jgi:anti-anti-sigma regulatory factor
MSNDRRLSSPLFIVCVTDNGVAVLQAKDKAFLNSQAQEFSRLFEKLKSLSVDKFILDFSNCDYLSSEGLSIAAQCWKWCHETGNGVMAAVVPDDPANEVRRLFNDIGLSRMIGASLQPTLAEAEKFLRPQGPMT